MRRSTRILLALLMIMGGTKLASGEMIETGFLNRSISLDGTDYHYQVYVPRDYEPGKSWPVILALHGGGERGSDGLLQTDIGLGRAIRRHADWFPAIVVFPQVPDDETPGWQGHGGRLALAALDSAMAEFNTDKSRVYLTGLSMGGNGSWYLAYHHPDRFAAAIIVCGFISERQASNGGSAYPPIVPEPATDPFAVVAQRIKHLPIWIFHGDADKVVSVEESRRMAESLRKVDADVHYTELPEVGHNSWDSAYSKQKLFEWLFKQHR